MLNVHDIAQDVGVSDETAKRWLQVLEKSDIIFYLRPYSNNLLKRTVKTPKMYFFDTGLVSYLTRYSTPEILQNVANACGAAERTAQHAEAHDFLCAGIIGNLQTSLRLNHFKSSS